MDTADIPEPDLVAAQNGGYARWAGDLVGNGQQ
jgi:hypothetical protein